MNRAKRIILIFTITILFIALTLPALGGSNKRRGSTCHYNAIDITNIESKKLEKNKSGLIYYTFRADVRNKTQRPLKVTVTFQAVDRNGYELEDVLFYDKVIKSNRTRTFSDRLVMQARDYKNIWEWKVERLRIK